jgi:hypothetical protein
LQRIFAIGIFCGGVSCYAATPLIVVLSPGHSVITRFHPWSPVATENHLDHAEKIQKVAQMTGTVDVFDPLCGELPHVQIFMNDGPTCSREMPSFSAIDLAKIRWSFKISS